MNNYFIFLLNKATAFWLNLTTFQKSGSKHLAQPFLKVDSKG